MPNTDPVKKATTDAPVVNATDQADEEWVVTFSGQTGAVIKIEKLDKATGQRTELTEEEYTAVGGWDTTGASAADYTDASALDEAYYQGAADVQSMMGMSYDASAYGESYEMTPEEQAYCQGMQDYQDYITYGV